MKVVSIGAVTHDGTNYHMHLDEPWTQAARKVEIVERESADPLVARARTQPVTHNLRVVLRPGQIFNETLNAPLREALLAELDTEDVAVALVVADDDGSNERYINVVCRDVDPDPDGIGGHFVATLVTHGDPRWRANTKTTVTWNATASGETKVVSNGGSLSARPRYVFKPTANKSGGSGNYYEYAVFKAVTWTSPHEYRQYPVSLTGKSWDTDALLTAGKIYSGNGVNNIGVVVNGKEVRRWVDDYDTATTDVWVNLDFAPSQTTRLLTGIGSGDSIDTIYAAQGIDAFPQQGILLINAEVFTYDGKNDLERTFLNVSRAAKGTTAATHIGGGGVTGDVIYWIQHDIWLVYGGVALRESQFDDDAPDTYWYIGYDGRKPMLDLAQSSNVQWYFDQFAQSGNENKYRSASWTAYESAAAIDDPCDKMAISRTSSTAETASERGWWTLPVAYPFEQLYGSGTAARFEVANWSVYLDDGVQKVLEVPVPAVQNEFETFGEPELAVSSSWPRLIRWTHQCAGAMEARLDTLSITYSEYPTIISGAEIDTYTLATTLKNETTGESMTLNLQIAVDEQLEVDTENHTVTLLDDNTNQYQALTLSTRRREILPLAPGSNTLRVTDVGLVGMTITIEFEERTYS